MNLILLKNNLKEGLSIISGARKDVLHLPILKNFLIETSDGKLILSSTDLEIGIVHKISAKIIDKGSIAIPFVMFLQIINNLLFERINLNLEGNNLSIITDNYSAKISTFSKSDFPIIPEIDENKEQSFEFYLNDFIQSISSIMSACQISDIRPELSGILFCFNIESVKITATDSFRLAEKTILSKKIKTNVSKNSEYIIPLKTIQEIVRIFSQSTEEKITVKFDENQILVKTENTKIISRLIDGKFPDYKTIIPSEFGTSAVVEKEDISNSLKLSGSLSNKLNEVKFTSDKTNKNIKVHSSSQEIGESDYILSAKITGETINTTFNWRFFLDGIKPIKSNDIFIGFNGEDKPTLIKSPQDNSFIYVIMPIRSN